VQGELERGEHVNHREQLEHTEHGGTQREHVEHWGHVGYKRVNHREQVGTWNMDS
jgi:hypothetical protein